MKLAIAATLLAALLFLWKYVKAASTPETLRNDDGLFTALTDPYLEDLRWTA